MNRSRVMNDRWYTLTILNISTFRDIDPIYDTKSWSLI
jgi:hypothetical protein